jgi:uroporphyrinogen-III synthase
MLTHEEIDELTVDADIISIGPMTSEIIRSHGLKVKHEAGEHSVPGIIEEVKRHYQRNR